MTKEELKQEAEEYAEGMAKYYESAHGSIPSQFEKYLRKAVEYGYNKANEWHYVKDGDLPKDEKEVQVLYQDCDKFNSYTCLYDKHGEFWLYYNLDDMLLERFDYNVIAWKEIVLPKESE